MGMTPQEIQEKHFHDTFRGYSHEEVDLFLDEVAVAFERLYRENQSFMRRVVDLEEQLKRAQEAAGSQPGRPHESFEEDPGVTESTLKRMLLIAQETADRAVQEARQRAREIQEQARARADEMMEHAERRVRELSSQRMEKEKELERAKEALRRFDQQYRASFRVFIESQLEALKDLPASPPGGDLEMPAQPSSSALNASPPPLGVPEAPPAAPLGMETVAMPTPPPVEQVSSGAGAHLDDSQLVDSADLYPKGDEEKTEASPQMESGRGRNMWADEKESDGTGVDDDPELVRTPKSTSSPGVPAPGGVKKDEGKDGTGGSVQNRPRNDRKEDEKAGPIDGNDAEEDRLIRELFWGDED